MTVGELIEKLRSEFSPETEVMFSYNYGDYGGTEAAEPVDAVEIQEVKWSPNTSTFRTCESDEDDEDPYGDDDEKRRREVVVLS